MRNLITAAAVLAATGASAGEWTGAYVGLQLGGINIDADVATPFGSLSFSEEGTLFGVHAGYRHDFGQFVLGGEIDVDATDLEIVPGLDVESLARLKAVAGYDGGPFLPYVTVGGTRADTNVGDETGYFGGFGLVYQTIGRLELGGEVLYSSFDDFGSVDVEGSAWSYRIRASIRF